jgi:hypothetical protein
LLLVVVLDIPPLRNSDGRGQPIAANVSQSTMETM